MYKCINLYRLNSTHFVSVGNAQNAVHLYPNLTQTEGDINAKFVELY